MNIVQAQETVEIPGPEIKEAGFIQVKELNIGDVVFVKSETGELVSNTITKLQYQKEPVEVYNLSVEGEETFFANDFAVHNKFGSHNAVCDVTLAPRISTAPTETWSISTKGQAFKNLFKHSGSTWGPFQADEGNNICLWGTVLNGCQYPPNKVLPAGNPCRGCDKAYGTDCSSGGCNPQCEMTCGTGGSPMYGNSTPDQSVGPDRIRFRSAFLFCDECGCGAAIKVTAPSGYIIKSITADVTSRMHSSSDPRIDGHLYFSRGMGWSLDCSMKPYAVHYMVPSSYDGRPTVELGGGTKYFFIYHLVTSAGVEEGNWVGVDLRDNWAELSNIELKLVKIGEVTGREVTVVNNSLLYYDGVNTTNPDLSSRWPTIQSGLISITTDGSNWSPLVDIASNWTIDGTLPQGAEGIKPVWANVIPTGSIAGNPVICPMSIYYRLPLGTIKGTVYEGDSCPVGGVAVGGGQVRLVGVSNSFGPIDVSSTGTYEFKDIPVDTYTVMMSTFPADYTADVVYCPAQPVALTSGEEEIVNLGLVKIEDAWFQTTGGDVHAQGSLTDPIPAGAADGPYCSLAGDGGYPGVVSYGSYTFGDDGFASETPPFGWLADSTAAGNWYDYFAALVDEDEGDPVLANGKPISGIYQISGDQVVDDPWDVASGESLVFLIGSDLTLQANITVAKGGFLAFIVDGDIIINPGVTILEGIYLADGDIETGTTGDETELQLVGKGMFLAQSLILQRDYYNERNNTDPAQTFTFRPDLWLHAPQELWKASYTWQELAP